MNGLEDHVDSDILDLVVINPSIIIRQVVLNFSLAVRLVVLLTPDFAVIVLNNWAKDSGIARGGQVRPGAKDVNLGPGGRKTQLYLLKLAGFGFGF